MACFLVTLMGEDIPNNINVNVTVAATCGQLRNNMIHYDGKLTIMQRSELCAYSSTADS